MKYSVIIPIYNAEKTLQRCLDSLVSQLNSSIEVLLVNDGSTDSSGDISKEYVTKSSCFKYFEQQNSGVSAARNKGLENASGDYILFVDSDDYVAPNYFENIDNCMNTNRTDLILFGAIFLNRNQNKEMVYCNKYYNGIDTIRQYSFLSKKQQMFALWNKVFVRRIIEEFNIRFAPKSNIGEDGAFIFKYILHTNKLTSISSVLYFVDESNMDSLSRKRRDDLCDTLIESYKGLYKTLSRTALDKESKRIFQEMLSRSFYRSAYSCFSEVMNTGYDRKTKNYELMSICSAYQQAGLRSYGREAIVLSLPVKLKLIPIIKLLFLLKNRGRKVSK